MAYKSGFYLAGDIHDKGRCLNDVCIGREKGVPKKKTK